jgi:hypothetical protein
MGLLRMVMRSTFGVLGCVSVSAVPLAVADPPAADQSAAPTVITTPASATPTTTAPTTTTATVAPTAPSAPSVSQTAGAAPAVSARDQIEKRLLAQGYRLEMRHGEKYFCRVTDTLGSRVTPVKACSTAEQLITKAQEGKEFTEWAQRTATMCPSNSTTSCK